VITCADCFAIGNNQESFLETRVFSTSLLRHPRHLLVAFIALTLLPASALLWMGWWLTKQDHVLEQQRMKQRQAQAADLIVTGVQQALSAAEAPVRTSCPRAIAARG
jgi:hypothetical protein